MQERESSPLWAAFCFTECRPLSAYRMLPYSKVTTLFSSILLSSFLFALFAGSCIIMIVAALLKAREPRIGIREYFSTSSRFSSIRLRM